MAINKRKENLSNLDSSNVNLLLGYMSEQAVHLNQSCYFREVE